MTHSLNDQEHILSQELGPQLQTKPRSTAKVSTLGDRDSGQKKSPKLGPQLRPEERERLTRGVRGPQTEQRRPKGKTDTPQKRPAGIDPKPPTSSPKETDPKPPTPSPKERAEASDPEPQGERSDVADKRPHDK